MHIDIQRERNAQRNGGATCDADGDSKAIENQYNDGI